MYEDDLSLDSSQSFDEYEDENNRPTVYGTLCLQLFLQSAASSTAVSLVPVIKPNDSQFVSHMAASAVLGSAFGKLLIGPLPDVIGARKASLCFSIAMSMSLLFLLHESTAIVAAFCIEFCSAVQWPCVVMILAAHRQLDQGVFWVSLASRVGSVCGLMTMRWRWMALAASWWAAIATSIIYHFVRDTPEATDLPPNPVDPLVLKTWFPEEFKRSRPWSPCKLLRLSVFAVQRNIYPSIRQIVRSGSFWMLALAHTGASLVKTSERILNSMGGNLAIWHGVGTLLGLLIAGPAFAQQTDVRARKWMVSRLYGITVLACYGLAVTSWWGSNELIDSLQGICVLLASFGMAVPFYHIPSLVGASYNEKGLFLAYTDGVAYATASGIWKLVGYTSGWSYGWALVALWVLVSGIVMHEFLEHYFCRPCRGNYETILLA